MRTCIQIRYAGGCTSIMLPNWLEQATRPNQRKFMRLAAEHATDCPENEENVRGLIEVLDTMIEDAKREATIQTDYAKLRPEEAAAQAEARRANNALKRLQDVKSDLKQMLEKYNLTRKFM